MRYFIATITKTVTTFVGVRPNGIVVADLVTRGLRAPSIARSLLTRLTGLVPACLPVVEMYHRQPPDAGATGMLRRNCLSKLRLRPSWRRMRPGSGASTREF